MTSNPFDWLNSINQTKEDMMVDDITEKQYSPFMINRGLSYFIDTVMDANQMNMFASLDNRLQYDYYMNSIRKKKRFSKWAKKTSNEDVEVIKSYFNINDSKALEALTILSKDQIDEIKNVISTKN